MSDSVRPHGRQPTRLPRPWDSPGKNTGVGCHFLLQCMKVKSENEVAQSCPTPSDPMDCSLPGSSIHGIFQARVLEWGAIAFSLLQCMKVKRGSEVSQSCPTLRPHGLQPTRPPRPWDFLSKSTAVGCQYLLRLFLYSLSQSTECSSPRYTTGLCWLSILCTVVCVLIPTS